MPEPWEARVDDIDLLLAMAERSVEALVALSAQHDTQVRRLARLMPPLAHTVQDHEAILVRMEAFITAQREINVSLQATIARLDRLMARVFRDDLPHGDSA